MIARVVKQVLANYPETRDNDKELLIKTWEHLGLYLSQGQQDKFKHIASPETIRRTRQKIQEGGLYPATERTRSFRKVKSAVIQQNAPTATPERLDGLFNRDDYLIIPRRNYTQ